MGPAWSSRHSISCSRHLSRSQAEIPLILAVQISRTTSPAERRAILHEFFEPTDEERYDGIKIPTVAHRAIAELVRDGFIKVLVTTNFDRLMEVALTDFGIVPTVISTADATKGAAPLVHQGA